MDIIIDQEVLEYLIYARRKALTLWLERQIGCWGPIDEVLVRTSEPMDDATYICYEVDGIHLYFHEDMECFEDVEIQKNHHGSDLPYRDFIVTGVKRK